MELSIIGIGAENGEGMPIGLVDEWGALEILAKHSNGRFKASDLPNPTPEISRAMVLGIKENELLTIKYVLYLGYYEFDEKDLGYYGHDKKEYNLGFKE